MNHPKTNSPAMNCPSASFQASLFSLIGSCLYKLFIIFQYQHADDEDPALGTGSAEGKSFWDIVADPRIMEKALDTENVDYNVTMAQTTR